MEEQEDPFQINREFERLIFDGVPDQPEPSFGRDNFGQVTPRYSGKSHNENGTLIDLGLQIIGEYSIDKTTGKETLTRDS